MRIGKRSNNDDGYNRNNKKKDSSNNNSDNDNKRQRRTNTNTKKNNDSKKTGTSTDSTNKQDDIDDSNNEYYHKNVGRAKSLSCDLITTKFLPVLDSLIINRLEKYASDMIVPTAYDSNNVTTEIESIPIRPLLFYSENSIQEFKQDVLYDTSDYFFGVKEELVNTNKKWNKKTKKKIETIDGWKIKLNAAKFERLLDERYGILRPIITKYPQVDIILRSIQRKYNNGYFSPFRQNSLPISKANSIILLFMIHRGGSSNIKIPWYGTVLLTLFFVVGLQPWALVLVIILFQYIVKRITYRRVSTMKRTIPLTYPYYYNNSNTESKLNTTKDEHHLTSIEEEEEERTYNGTTIKISKTIQEKYNLLNKPVGTLYTSIKNSNTTIDMSLYDTILIGYGIGTLYTGALLSRAGRKVLVLSPRHDASGCISYDTNTSTTNQTTATTDSYTTNYIRTKFNNGKKIKKNIETINTTILQSISYDIDNCTITKIQRQQQLLAPALYSTNGDKQGGIRFAQMGTKNNGYTFEIVTIPSILIPTSSSENNNISNETTTTTGSNTTVLDFPPIALCANNSLSMLMEQTSAYYGDGYNLNVNGQQQQQQSSLSNTYVQACDTINESASMYYLSRIIPDIDTSDAIRTLLLGSNSSKSKNKSKSKSSTSTTTKTKNESKSANDTSSTAGQYEKSVKVPASGLLYTIFDESYTYLRVMMAAIGMKYENISPYYTSLGCHVTNIGSTIGNTSDGMYYPIGGPRSICIALQTVIEQNGGLVLSGVPISELLFNDEDTNDDNVTVQLSTTTATNNSKKDNTTNNDTNNDTNNNTSIDEDIPKPYCIGVKLRNEETITFDKERFTSKTKNSTSKPEPIIITTTGYINTYIHLLPDTIRTKYHVPYGIPALKERRPMIHILYVFAGTPNDLQIEDCASTDYYRVPAATDILHPHPNQQQQQQEQEEQQKESTQTQEAAQEQEQPESAQGQNTAEATTTTTKQPSSYLENNEHFIRNKASTRLFTSGQSWMRITFPSAKDPSFELRYGPKVTTCIVSIEADDRFVTEYETAHPKLYVIHSTTENDKIKHTLLDSVTDDVLDIYPQLKVASLLFCDVSGPYNCTNVQQTPERFLAKGINCIPYYPNLYVGGTDLTVDTTSGSIVSGWMIANSVQQYQPYDYYFLQKNITTDIERFLNTTTTTSTSATARTSNSGTNEKHNNNEVYDFSDSDDLAVPLPIFYPPPPIDEEIDEQQEPLEAESATTIASIDEQAPTSELEKKDQ